MITAGPMLCIAESGFRSLTSSPCECERPIPVEHSLRIQTSDAPFSGACNSSEAADKAAVHVLSGPCKGQALSHGVIWAQCECEDSGELIQFGYLKFEMPTGSAVVVEAQIAGSLSDV